MKAGLQGVRARPARPRHGLRHGVDLQEYPAPAVVVREAEVREEVLGDKALLRTRGLPLRAAVSQQGPGRAGRARVRGACGQARGASTGGPGQERWQRQGRRRAHGIPPQRLPRLRGASTVPHPLCAAEARISMHARAGCMLHAQMQRKHNMRTCAHACMMDACMRG